MAATSVPVVYGSDISALRRGLADVERLHGEVLYVRAAFLRATFREIGFALNSISRRLVWRPLEPLLSAAIDEAVNR